MSFGGFGESKPAETEFRFEIYLDPSDASRVLIRHPNGTFCSERPQMSNTRDGFLVGCTFVSKVALERIRAVPECGQ